MYVVFHEVSQVVTSEFVPVCMDMDTLVLANGENFRGVIKANRRF